MTVAVDAVVYYKVNNPMISVLNVEDCHRSTQLLAATTLRNILGMKTLSEILSDRDSVAHYLQVKKDSLSSQNMCIYFNVTYREFLVLHGCYEY